MVRFHISSFLKTPSVIQCLGTPHPKNQQDLTIKRISVIIFKSIATLITVGASYGFLATWVSPKSPQNLALMALSILGLFACYDLFVMVGNVEGSKSEIAIHTVKRISSEDLLEGAENAMSAVRQGIADKSMQPVKELANEGKAYVVLQGTIFGKIWLPAVKLGLLMQETFMQKCIER